MTPAPHYIKPANSNTDWRAALTAAVLFHVGLLALAPGVGPLVMSASKVVSVTLQLTPPRKVQASTPKSLAPQPEKQASQAAPRDNQASTTEEEEVHAAVSPAPTNRLSVPTITQWLQRETDNHLQSKPNDLAEFAASFKLDKPAQQPPVEAYRNPYGETHVTTRLGDRDVCYLESSEHIKDNWSQGLVMFYDCGASSDNEFELP